MKLLFVKVVLFLHYVTSSESTSHSNSNTEALRLLDKMLRKYDRRSTPTNNIGLATNVSVQLLVASMGSINTENMDYVTDVYLRQRWSDPRLSHSNMTEALDLADPNLVKAIWKPEVFFPNAKEANFQFVTVPNVLIRIHPNGEILYILRLRLKFSCMMELSRYPLDRQICDMQIASFSKTTRELLLRWDSSKLDPSVTGSSVTVSSDLRMPQFIIESVHPTLCYERFHLGNYSCLVAHFYLKRSVSFHLIQSYLPSILIVAISWVSFWMDIEAVPGRISLGVITLLAVSQQGGQEKNIPQTSYVKALDVWMGLCTAFVFSALVEFTVVNFWFRKFKKQKEHAMALMLPMLRTASNMTNVTNISGLTKNTMKLPNSRNSHNHDVEMSIRNNEDNCNSRDGEDFETRLFGNMGTLPPSHTKQKPHPAELVDQASRGLFPLGFAICNVAYWVYYLYLADQDLAKMQNDNNDVHGYE